MLKNLSSAARKTIKEAAFAINAVEPFNGGASFRGNKRRAAR